MNFGRLLELLGLRRSLEPEREIVRALEREHRRLEEAESPPRTWTMMVNGFDCAVLRMSEDKLEATIWTPIEHWQWRRGDYLVLRYRSGLSTRYRIDVLDRRAGMQFADCSFAPRPLQRPDVDCQWMGQ